MNWNICANNDFTLYYAFHPIVKNYLVNANLHTLLDNCRQNRHTLVDKDYNTLHHYYINRDKTKLIFRFNDRKLNKTIINEFPEYFI